MYFFDRNVFLDDLGISCSYLVRLIGVWATSIEPVLNTLDSNLMTPVDRRKHF